MRTYKIVVFGATGYTGQYVVEELAKIEEYRGKFAIAGRNELKMSNLLDNVSKNLSIPSLLNVPMMVADVADESSIDAMVASTEIVINCVGPYRLFGEVVVKSCLKHATHAVDISGEPTYLEGMQVKYNEEARSKSIFIVGACGADSIPADLGLLYTVKQFDGILNEVASFLHYDCDYRINSATLDSALYGIAAAHELRALRAKLYSSRPTSVFRQRSLGNLFRSSLVRAWCMPFPGSDRSVVYSSQMSMLRAGTKDRIVQYMPYLRVPSIFAALRLMACGVVILLGAKIRALHSLMMKFPRFMTLGLFDSKGPTREQLNKSTFELTFHGKGWQDLDRVDRDPPTQQIVTRVSGPDFGYLTCSKCVVQAAITILEEGDTMPNG